MADQPSPTESDDRIERRIDEVISQAAELARELKEEVGDPEPAGLDRDQKFFESQASSESAPEMQLAQADAAIAHAAREIGSQPPPPMSPPPTPPPPKATKVTLPPRNAKPGATSPAAGPVTATAPGDMPTVAAGAEVGGASPIEAGTAIEGAAGTNDAVPAAPAAPAAPTALPQAEPAQLASPILERVARLFETIDRPFAGINGTVRWVLGWVALVFFVGAASLLFFVIL